MKKLFLSLSTVVSITGITPAISNLSKTTNYDTKMINQKATPVQAIIENAHVDKTEADVILSTSINLTTLGINNNNDLKAYDTIALPDFYISFLRGTKTVTDGYQWDAKMTDGESNWATTAEIEIPNYDSWQVYIAKTESKHNLWHDANGNYHLTLTYRINCQAVSQGKVTIGRITAATGSVANFY